MKVMCSKKLKVLEEGRLVNFFVNKREDEGIGWWEEYDILKRNYELGSEHKTVHI